jgi:hypothetical protein
LTLALVTPVGAEAATPVPSLQPAKTAKLWSTLVKRRTLAAASAGDCLRVVFYAPTDWLRLATTLASHNVSCAQYYISIPPLAADKTNFRPDQPWRIRALGPNFHAVEEINYNGWANWVAANGGSWYAAGVEARRRMAAQGFDVASGDTWSVNEASSAVRTGTGVARQNLRDLVRGLYAGDGGPAAKGVVFVIGPNQDGASLGTYKGTLQMWFADTAFWSDMSAYVSDWSQEVYGDVMRYAVAGATPDVRAGELAAWLEHPLSLASAGGSDIAAAQSFLQNAYSPLGNAAWRYGSTSGFGFTDVPVDVMQDYVSAQTYAMRSAGMRYGFAWTPKAPAGETASQFATESGALVDRLATAIHDSVSDPAAACTGTCIAALDAASFNESWRDFSNWSTPALVFSTPPTSAATGAALGPVTVQLQLAGVTRADLQPVSVTLSSSSPQGSFASTPDGPWTNVLTLQIPVGSTDASFYYRDGLAGSATIAANAPGRSGASILETIVTPQPAGPFPPEPKPKPPTKKPPKIRVVGVTYHTTKGRLHVQLRTVDPKRKPVARTVVRIAVRRNGHWLAATTVYTNAKGVGIHTRALRSGCYSVKVVRVQAKGFAWNKLTPKNGFCVRSSTRARSA